MFDHAFRVEVHQNNIKIADVAIRLEHCAFKGHMPEVTDYSGLFDIYKRDADFGDKTEAQVRMIHG